MADESRYTFEVGFREDLPMEEITRRIKAALRAGDLGERTSAVWLAKVQDEKRYVSFGQLTMRQYAYESFGMKEARLRKLVAMGRALSRLPCIDESYAAGRITTSHVRVLMRIATPKTDRAWASWSEEHTTRELEEEALGRTKGDLPEEDGPRSPRSAQQVVGARLSPVGRALWERARAKVQAMSGGEVSDQDLLLFGAQLIVSSRPDGTVPGWSPVDDRAFLVHVYPRRVNAQGLTEFVTFGEDGEEIPMDMAELANMRQIPLRGREAAAVPDAATVVRDADALRERAPAAETSVGSVSSVGAAESVESVDAVDGGDAVDGIDRVEAVGEPPSIMSELHEVGAA